MRKVTIELTRGKELETIEHNHVTSLSFEKSFIAIYTNNGKGKYYYKNTVVRSIEDKEA